jgi:ribonucleoside-diphosphate reductase alpha chain
MCRSIKSAGARRGAMMATMRCDHPDIEDFIAAKSDPARLRNFNLSVLVTNKFMDAVRLRQRWPLVFGGKVFREVDAAALWDRIMRATYDYAEPGVIFIDRINELNNLAYVEDIRATNPCGEQPLPPYGACLLGSINLTRFIENPFTPQAALDLARMEQRAAIAVRMLDNAIDVSGFPLPAQRHEALTKRRIGLGITGLADALIMMGQRYGTAEAATLAQSWMRSITNAAYRASALLAEEKGAFKLFDRDQYLSRPFAARLDKDVQRLIAKHGIRNGCLTSIAPTGTISLFAGNVSSGIEPVFSWHTRRRVMQQDGTAREDLLEDFAFAQYRRAVSANGPLPQAFVTVEDLTPADHLNMQAALQPFVDSSISKTINCPANLPFESFQAIYQQAYDKGLKGCTTYRPNAVTGAVLQAAGPAADQQPAGHAGPGLEKPEGLVRPALAEPVPLSGPGGVIYLSPPLERDAVLSGATYKLKWPESPHALYITINDIEQANPDPALPPRRRPFEIFINTRNLEHYAWTVALTRMISAVFRRGGDVTFVAEELKAVFDPQGGRWIGGRYVPSLLAAIGETIETHMRRIGFMPPGTTASTAASESQSEHGPTALEPPDLGKIAIAPGTRKGSGGRSCPRCGERAFVRREGCWTCDVCGFSRCG